MICKNCGCQNSNDAERCVSCNRALQKKHIPSRNAWLIAAAVILIVSISIGLRHMRKDNTVEARGTAEAHRTAATSADEVPDENSYPAEKDLPGSAQESVQVKQVLLIDDGSLVVLYSNGTVRSAGDAQYLQGCTNWTDIIQLYYFEEGDWHDGEYHDNSYLAGLTTSGTVMTTNGSLSGWSNVKELIDVDQGIIGITKDGRILLDDAWEEEACKTSLESMTNVETLIYADLYEMFFCLKKNGDVHIVDTSIHPYYDPNQAYWRNVLEVRDAGHKFYVIKADGTVETFEDVLPNLENAVKLVHCYDWILGISEDGRLLTENGGNIYTNLGAMMVKRPGHPSYGGEVDIRQYDQVRDIFIFWGIFLLNTDGTVDHIGYQPEWDLTSWNNIKQVYGSGNSLQDSTLYGLRQDGSVITARWENNAQTITDQYRGWVLQDIFPGTNGVVGLTADGKLVGDGIYENIDFTVFDP